jgi:hypothetical protein
MKSRKTISLPAKQAIIGVPVLLACTVSIYRILQIKPQLDRMSYRGTPELPIVVLISGSCDLRP